MSQWFCLSLGDAMLAPVYQTELIEQFVACYGERPDPGICLWSRHEAEGRLHCELRVYFPPATASLARQLGARPCVTPSACGLGLLTGTAEESIQ